MAFQEVAQSKTNFNKIFNFEKENDVIEGIYYDTHVAHFPNGDQVMYSIELDNGEQYDIRGYAVLKRKFENIKIGSRVRVTYVSDVATKAGYRAKNFTVEVDQ